MNKKDFLKSLEKKLSILDEQEVKDIINEYEDIIDQKVKDGKTEEEAVKEFGSIDELSSEILKTYKLNSKYTKENESLKNTVDSFEDAIKKASNSLANFFKGLNGGNKISVELIFELIIKFLILIFILAILRLPFDIFIAIGKEIFDIAVYPLDKVLGVLWHMGMVFLYFVVSALIFISLFKHYINTDNKDKKVTKKNKTKAETIEKKEVIEVEKNNNALNSIISGIYKVFMVMIFLIPLWFVNFGLSISLLVSIYYTIIGINIWGLIIMFTGLSFCSSWFTAFFYRITFNTKKKVSSITVFIGIVLTAVGVLAFTSNILSFEYIDETKKLDLNYQTYTKIYNIEDNNIKFTYGNANTSIIDYKINNEIEDNVVYVEIAYPSEIMTIRDVNFVKYSQKPEYDIEINDIDISSLRSFKVLYNEIINELKAGKIYNYSEESYLTINISANENTMNLIK